MSKKIIFLFNDEINFLKKNNPKEILLICAKNSQKEKILKLNFEVKTISEYSSEGIEKKSLDWIKTWPDIILHDNKNFKELFTYNKLSIFWFLETRLYLLRIKDLILLIEQLKNVLKIENPEKIWVYGSSDVHHIISKLNPGIIENKEKKKKIKKNTKYMNYEGFLGTKLSLLKFFRNFNTCKNISKDKTRKKILFITEIGNWRTEFDFIANEFVKKDVFFSDIVKKLEKEHVNIKVIDFENNPNRLLQARKISKKRNKEFQVDLGTWESYLTKEITKSGKKKFKEIIEFWNKLKISDNFKTSLKYDDISLYEIILEDFNSLFRSFKAYVSLVMIDAARKIIEIENPAAIIMHDEYGALQIAIINEAKRRKIPVISLQHGLISDQILPYYHKSNHVINPLSNDYFPLPDKMLVWSKSAKENLIKNGKFNPNIPIITGNHRLDFLSDSLKKFDKDQISKKYKIIKNKTTILFATENLPNAIERENVARCVLETIKNLDDTNVIIKLHPNELSDTLYKKIISEYNIKNCIIIKNSNLYELIFYSDIVIVSYSTVGIEAMMMQKPVISLNLMGLHNDTIMIKKELSIIVKNSKQLPQAINDCLKPELVTEKIRIGSDFSEKELGIIDGKSLDRIINEILLSINGNIKD